MKFFCLAILVFLPLAQAVQQPIRGIDEFGFLQWLDGVRGQEYVLRTSHYALRYHHQKAGLIAMRALPEVDPTTAYESALPDLPPLEMVCSVHVGSQTHPAKAASDDARTSAIVESGRFFQRRWQTMTVPGLSGDPERSGLELSAWPDRLTLQWRFCPIESMPDARLSLRLKMGAGWQAGEREGVTFLQSPHGEVYLCHPLSGGAKISFEEKQGELTLQSSAATWSARSHPSMGLVLYPTRSKAQAEQVFSALGRSKNVQVRATMIEPTTEDRQVRYVEAQDWHVISVPKGSEGDDGRLRMRIRLRNPSDRETRVRLMFDGVPFYVPGLSAMWRDLEGNPTGHFIQLSKNWHGKSEPEDHPARFSGEWFHGITSLLLPPHCDQEMEWMMVGENWGGMAAASHAQLSTIGYGGNQQWDQAALGNRGEALCYDMDHVLTDNAFTDSRPFGMFNQKGERSWNINVGGGSVMRYFDAQGKAVPHRKMRVQYLSHGPNFADALFRGLAAGDAIDFSYSAGISRADDCTRGWHRIRAKVLRDVDFSRLSIYQQAGDSYHYNQGSQCAWGNLDQAEPVRQWNASGTPGQAVGESMELKGLSPWFAVSGGAAEQGYHPADHGVVIRHWKARLGGKPVPFPWLREFRTAASVSILELVPPPGVTRLQQGDFVELDFVRVYLPQKAEHYAGKNESFRQALRQFPGGDRMIAREARALDLRPQVTLGTLQQATPVVILAKNNRAGVVLQASSGVMPITFAGLTDYRQPLLEEKTSEGWKAIDQSVVGRDFWQCDAEAVSGTWRITYNLQLDVPTGVSGAQKREYRFRVGKP